MVRTDNKSTLIEVNELEIKHAIVDYIKAKHPDLKDIKPKITIYVNGELGIDGAKVKFEHES